MSADDNEVTDGKLKVYECVFAMFIKFILVIAGLVAFFWILSCILNEADIWQKLVLGFLEMLLTGTIFVVYKHYFPHK